MRSVVSKRILSRALLQSFLGFLFFWLGSNYSNSKCLENFSPEHLNHPELIQSWNSLKHKETFLVVLVLTAPKNGERRKIIRETWANVQRTDREKFLLYFVLGNSELSDEIMVEINQENSQFKDILALPLVDTYQTLTRKILTSFVQINRNVKFKYLLKVDDDSYVQLPLVIEELTNSNFDRALYWGFFDGRAPVFHKGKWAEKDYKICDRYIPYALGGGYVLSQVNKMILG